jgi:16S rRNA C1402 N4-methylase RsmH
MDEDLEPDSSNGTDMTKPINQIHKPVALDRTIELLGAALGATGAGKVLVDGTLGLGGDSEAFLEKFSELTLIGIDRDPEALKLAGERLKRFADRTISVHAVYSEVAEVISEEGFDGVERDSARPRRFVYATRTKPTADLHTATTPR